MKRIIITIVFALAAMALSAKEVSKNPSTGLILDETAGIYSLIGKTGVIPLGTAKEARNFMFKADVCFSQKLISECIEIGNQKYSVCKDDDGLYIIKVGFGAVKVRPSDATLFLGVTEGLIVKTKGKKMLNVLRE